MPMLSKFICSSENAAFESKGELIEEGHQIIFGPAKIDFGTTDMTKYNNENYPYDDAWVVIGFKE